MIGKVVSHYKILEKLGEGGMGVVYKAEDTKLKRNVALKFLPPNLLAGEEEKERFIREAQAAAALNHPNICTIHSIEEHSGNLFIVMEYLDGVTLRQKMAQSQLKTTDVLSYAVQIGHALQEAHSKGIVHRDIKPENIMVTPKGQIKVMDFGLAHSKGALRLTKTNSWVGTLAYSAPEMVQGAAVDHRADLFCLGLVCYEMIAGRPAFSSEFEAGLLYAIVHVDPPPIGSDRPNVPRSLIAIIERALQKQPENRYQSAQVFVKDLNAVSQGNQFKVNFDVPITTRALPCIAILPFQNLSTEKESEYFADGIAEDLINALSHLKDIQVVSRTSSFAFRASSPDLETIRQKLKADTIVEGSVRKAGASVRLVVSLVNTTDGTQVWSESFNREMTDIFAVQDEICRAVVQALELRLIGTQKRELVAPQTTSIEAYHFCLKGRYFWARRPIGIQKAIECFRAALELDPAYSLAYVGLADCYNILGSWENGSRSPSEVMPIGRAYAERALQLNPNQSEAFSSLGYSLLHYERDLSQAETEIRRSLEHNPNYAIAHHWHSHCLVAMNRFEESLAASKRALELDPLDLVINSHMSWHYLMAHDFDSAVESSLRTLGFEEKYHFAHLFLGLALEQKMMMPQSIDALRKSVELSGGFWLGALGHAYGVANDRAAALGILKDLVDSSTHRYVPAYEIALIHSALGDTDQMFEWLEKAYAERSGWLVYLENEPRLRIHHSDQRFKDISNKTRRATTKAPK
jgi:serine/threonine protein kinase/Tfp pilus assembly protein PilF